MTKEGILHDYDLRANLEESSKEQTCIICGSSPMRFQWSDCSGEAMCTTCGCPYQLKWGSDQREKESKYPYVNLQEKFIPIIREYWQETRKFACYGIMLGDKPGYSAFISWLKEKHPECMVKEGS